MKNPKTLEEMGINGEVVLCFSGGVDSFIGNHYLTEQGRVFHSIYFDLGSRYTSKERNHMQEFWHNKVKIVFALSWLGTLEQRDTAFIPYRNLYIAMTASLYYAPNVCICGLKDDVCSDKNEEVFKLWSDHLSVIGQKDVKIFSPFWEMTKSEIVAWYLSTGGKERGLLDTVSCYSNGIDNYCGECRACFRKCVAFGVNGIDLPFYDGELVAEYREAAINGKYVPERNTDILRVFP